MELGEETKKLKTIRPGDLFEFQRHEDKSLKRMRYAIDEAQYLIIDHDAERAVASFKARDITAEIHETSGTISSSLFPSGGGLPESPSARQPR